MTRSVVLLTLVSVAPSVCQVSSLHRDAFVMDGHIHVMTRQLLQGLDIGQRYPDGHFDLIRAQRGGLDAMFFSVYTPEPYYPGRHEVKNTFRVVELALDQIEKNNNVLELALTASDIERINRRGKMAAFLDLEGGFDLDGDINLLRALYRLGTAFSTTDRTQPVQCVYRFVLRHQPLGRTQRARPSGSRGDEPLRNDHQRRSCLGSGDPANR